MIKAGRGDAGKRKRPGMMPAAAGPRARCLRVERVDDKAFRARIDRKTFDGTTTFCAPPSPSCVAGDAGRRIEKIEDEISQCGEHENRGFGFGF